MPRPHLTIESALDEAQFSIRTANCLRNANLSSVYSLLRLGGDELKTLIPHLGRKGFAEIEEVLGEYGWQLGTIPEYPPAATGTFLLSMTRGPYGDPEPVNGRRISMIFVCSEQARLVATDLLRCGMYTHAAITNGKDATALATCDAYGEWQDA